MQVRGLDRGLLSVGQGNIIVSQHGSDTISDTEAVSLFSTWNLCFRYPRCISLSGGHVFLIVRIFLVQPNFQQKLVRNKVFLEIMFEQTYFLEFIWCSSPIPIFLVQPKFQQSTEQCEKEHFWGKISFKIHFAFYISELLLSLLLTYYLIIRFCGNQKKVVVFPAFYRVWPNRHHRGYDRSLGLPEGPGALGLPWSLLGEDSHSRPTQASDRGRLGLRRGEAQPRRGLDVACQPRRGATQAARIVLQK